LHSQETSDDFSDLEQSLSNEDVDNDSNRLMNFGEIFDLFTMPCKTLQLQN